MQKRHRGRNFVFLPLFLCAQKREKGQMLHKIQGCNDCNKFVIFIFLQLAQKKRSFCEQGKVKFPGNNRI